MKKPKFGKRNGGGSSRDQNEVHQERRPGGLPERQREASQGRAAAKDTAVSTDQGDASPRENTSQSTGIGSRLKQAVAKVAGIPADVVVRKPKFPGPTIVAIFAVDRLVARGCAEANGLKPTEWVFLIGPEVLFASQKINMVVWRTGTYYTRKNLIAVEELIEKLQVEYIEAPKDVR